MKGLQYDNDLKKFQQTLPDEIGNNVPNIRTLELL